MHPDVEARLLQLNRAFYQRFAAEFAATRSRPRPGTLELLEPLPQDAALLDLGCGNGNLARALAARGHCGRYLGLDFSPELLAAARRAVDHPRATFAAADLTEPGWSEELEGGFDWVCLLALLHHIPGRARRARLVTEAGQQLATSGRALVSVWNFRVEAELEERVRPWSEVGLDAEQVEAGDYLLDWRRGGRGLRYVHHFSPQDLEQLARQAQLTVEETSFAGGESGRLNLLQRWRRPAGS